ncbi:protein phosphatase 2C-like protein [Nocardiopsis sp. Huas11]|uniref:protein phosphatase 2C domain-containing protein n=1 Tax=Nocardiopsis sp. Huas11 TaxID=2183912 RepID=UPI000EB33C13|nr:protein phosphatase 2C domain-containing protein [Nocardiopsis sp. Huas11]RKS06665.1 protein phosphatase 2C-like protein [Nocardiopsis sp. Huas11]
MPFLLATEPGRPDRDNEDFAAATPDGAVVLDGVGAPHGVDVGCAHGAAWYTHRLGGLLVAGLAGGRPLRDVLAEAITTAASLHGPGCDLGNQDGPSATVVLVRFAGDRLEHLVLCDSVLLVEDTGGTVTAIRDTRLDDLRRELAAAPPAADGPEPATGPHARGRGIRARRNVPGGFWTAGADPRASAEALTGSLPLDGLAGFAALTDGATRGVELFGSQTWRDCYALAAGDGPAALIEHVRALEREDAGPRRYTPGKLHDDATAVIWSPA